MICYTCGGTGHPARLCPTPRDQAAGAVEDEETDDETVDGDVCGVDWECKLDDVHEAGDATYHIDEDEHVPSKWQRFSAVVDSGAAENVIPLHICEHVEIKPTERSIAGIGFRGAGGDRICNHGQREIKVKMADGKKGNSTWQVADVKRPLMSVAKMISAGNQVHLDGSNPRVVRPKGDVIPLRKTGNVFLMDLWVKNTKQVGRSNNMSSFARQN